MRSFRVIGVKMLFDKRHVTNAFCHLKAQIILFRAVAIVYAIVEANVCGRL